MAHFLSGVCNHPMDSSKEDTVRRRGGQARTIDDVSRSELHGNLVASGWRRGERFGDESDVLALGRDSVAEIVGLGTPVSAAANVREHNEQPGVDPRMAGNAHPHLEIAREEPVAERRSQPVPISREHPTIPAATEPTSDD